ncbi:MAG TPA: purine-nucleoside phosphorylase [Nitrososphaerales archaeon]|nr:purine-nucleoside phosphorylase [Nitrososphaerales archaeon]
MTEPAHLRMKPDDVASLVVTAGDPARVEQLSRMLDGSKLVNSNRGFIVYTGHHRGKRVTVATHGIGGPSCAIVFEELHMLGAQVIVRLGTSGGMVKELGIGDMVVPTGAAYGEGSLKMYVPDGVLPATPDLALTSAILGGCRASRVRHKEGLVFSSDAFYAEDPTFIEKWTKRGVVAVEMECATLFTLGLLRGFKAASLLVVSDSLVNKAEKTMALADALAGSVDKAAKIVLDAITGLPGDR